MPQKFVIENVAENPDEIVLTVQKNEQAHYVLYGYADVEKKISVHLQGEGASATLTGVLIGAQQSCRIHTFQHHDAPHTNSDLLIKTVLTGNADFKYRGMIRIEKIAQCSNAYQRNENKLIRSAARVDTKPELEILADDVRCTHGATIGKLDEMTLFYLQSRGLRRSEAEALALEGFVNAALARIPDETIKEKIQEYIQQELHKQY